MDKTLVIGANGQIGKQLIGMMALANMPVKVMIRKQEDPFSYAEKGQIGGINVIDLANLYSCCFIQTDDLGNEQVHVGRCFDRGTR